MKIKTPSQEGLGMATNAVGMAFGIELKPSELVAALRSLGATNNDEPEKTQPLLTKNEVAGFLHISLPTVNRMIADGRLVAKKLGTAPNSPVRICSSAIDALMEGVA